MNGRVIKEIEINKRMRLGTQHWVEKIMSALDLSFSLLVLLFVRYTCLPYYL